MSAAAMVFLNYGNYQTCIDLHPDPTPDQGLDGNGWGVQACNEMVMPFASRETTSMFPVSEWNQEENTAVCEARFSQKP